MYSRPLPGIEWVCFTIYYEGDSKEVSNDFWYSVSAGSIDATTNFAALITAFQTAVYVPFNAQVSSEVRIEGIKGTFSNGNGAIGVDHYISQVGSSVGAPLPMDVAVVVQKETAGFQRKDRGRWFFAGFDAGVSEGSYLSNTGISTILPFAVALKTAVTAGGITLSPAHFSRVDGGLEAITNTPIVGLLATARRRRNRF